MRNFIEWFLNEQKVILTLLWCNWMKIPVFSLHFAAWIWNLAFVVYNTGVHAENTYYSNFIIIEFPTMQIHRRNELRWECQSYQAYSPHPFACHSTVKQRTNANEKRWRRQRSNHSHIRIGEFPYSNEKSSTTTKKGCSEYGYFFPEMALKKNIYLLN